MSDDEGSAAPPNKKAKTGAAVASSSSTTIVIGAAASKRTSGRTNAASTATATSSSSSSSATAANGDESDDEKVTNGYQAAFAWQHYHFSIKPTTALETEVVPTLNALAHRVLVVLNDVEKDCKNRDILPQLGRKFVKEASERAADRRLALVDLAGVEYAVTLARRDVPRIFFDVNEGLLPKLALCPQLVQVFVVAAGKRSPAMSADAPLPCTCGAAGVSSVAANSSTTTATTEAAAADGTALVSSTGVTIVASNAAATAMAIDDADLHSASSSSVLLSSSSSPAELWEALDKSTQRAKKAVDEHWARRLRMQQQVNAQLHEALNAAEARATDAEARLAEERESNAKLWDKISTIQKQLQKMTRPLVK